MPTSLNFFAINNVHHEILGFFPSTRSASVRLTRSGWYSPAQYWQAFYTHLGNKGKDLSMPMKFTSACLCAHWAF
ncbi:hypothetical protein ACP0HM_21325 [Escherichia coli]